MKKLILFLFIISISTTSFAFLGFGEKEVKEVKEEKPPEPVSCNHSIDIGDGVFYIFSGGCEKFIQIGIIDTRENKLISLNSKGKITKTAVYATAIDRQEDTEKNWGKINEVKFSAGK